jgi:hypothetical protein
LRVLQHFGGSLGINIDTGFVADLLGVPVDGFLNAAGDVNPEARLPGGSRFRARRLLSLGRRCGLGLRVLLGHEGGRGQQGKQQERCFVFHGPMIVPAKSFEELIEVKTATKVMRK